MPLPAGRRFEIFTKRTRNDRGHEPPQLQRGARRCRDRTGRHAVRHVQPSDDRRQHLQLRQRSTRQPAAPASPRFGVEQVGALVTRGVLIDVAALKGVPVLPDTYEITPQDLAGRARRAEADAAARRRGADPHRLGHALVEPGQRALSGLEPWPRRRRRRVARTGRIRCSWARTTAASRSRRIQTSSSRVPSTRSCSSSTAFICSRISRLDELAARRVHEFALIVEPLKIQGGTGSTVAPIAIR